MSKQHFVIDDTTLDLIMILVGSTLPALVEIDKNGSDRLKSHGRDIQRSSDNLVSRLAEIPAIMEYIIKR